MWGSLLNVLRTGRKCTGKMFCCWEPAGQEVRQGVNVPVIRHADEGWKLTLAFCTQSPIRLVLLCPCDNASPQSSEPRQGWWIETISETGSCSHGDLFVHLHTPKYLDLAVFFVPHNRVFFCGVLCLPFKGARKCHPFPYFPWQALWGEIGHQAMACLEIHCCQWQQLEETSAKTCGPPAPLYKCTNTQMHIMHTCMENTKHHTQKDDVLYNSHIHPKIHTQIQSEMKHGKRNHNYLRWRKQEFIKITSLICFRKSKWKWTNQS